MHINWSNTRLRIKYDSGKDEKMIRSFFSLMKKEPWTFESFSYQIILFWTNCLNLLTSSFIYLFMPRVRKMSWIKFSGAKWASFSHCNCFSWKEKIFSRNNNHQLLRKKSSFSPLQKNFSDHSTEKYSKRLFTNLEQPGVETTHLIVKNPPRVFSVLWLSWEKAAEEGSVVRVFKHTRRHFLEYLWETERS